jgi:hypothetical protein
VSTTSKAKSASESRRAAAQRKGKQALANGVYEKLGRALRAKDHAAAAALFSEGAAIFGGAQ